MANGSTITVGLTKDIVELCHALMQERDNLQTHLDMSAQALDAVTRELEAVKFAAHMPGDYEYGLPSWICQRLYAGYIGAPVSQIVMQQIESGRLVFPNAPVYKENARLRDALKASYDGAISLNIELVERVERERDEARTWARRMKRERDEIQKQLDEEKNRVTYSYRIGMEAMKAGKWRYWWIE